MARETKPSTGKILELESLARRIQELRRVGGRVVHCHGVFDLLHVGHIRYFEGARRHGDLLIVTLTPDRFVDKGAFRPAFSERLRLEAVAALSVVDWVALNDGPTAEETLRLLRPDVYAKGAEFRDVGADPTGKMEQERRVAAEIGCEIAFVDDLVFSSSRLINQHLETYPPEVARRLDGLRERFDAADVAALLERIARLSVLVVGDTSVEHTIQVRSDGLSALDRSPVVSRLTETRTLVGVPSLAARLAQLAGHVDVVTLVGAGSAPSQLACDDKSALRMHCVEGTTADMPTRQRWVDADTDRVWLTLHDETTRVKDQPSASRVVDQIRVLEARPDVVILADQGLGSVSAPVVAEVTAMAAEMASFLVYKTSNRAVGMDDQAQTVDDLECDLAIVDDDDPVGASRSDGESYGSAMRARTFAVLRHGKACRVRDQSGRIVETPFLTSGPASERNLDGMAATLALGLGGGGDVEQVVLLAEVARLLGTTVDDPVRYRQRLRKQLTSLLR